MQVINEQSYQSGRIAGQDMLFLTSGCCEETGQISAERLVQMGLGHGEIGGTFYPLTDDESKFIGEHLVQMGSFQALTGYSVLFNGNKYLAPAIEIDFYRDDNRNAVVTKGQAKLENEQLHEMLKKLAAITGGHYRWESDPALEFNDEDGKYVGELLIPFEYAQAHANDFESWLAHLETIGRKAQELITS